jgi:hypothetical protein
MNKAEQFFYDNGGYSYDAKVETEEQGHIRSAIAMASAEEWAMDNGYFFDWINDDNGCSGCGCESDDCSCSSGEPHETLGCIMRSDENDHAQSLWGICGADANYRRVVEAELAMEERAVTFAAKAMDAING